MTNERSDRPSDTVAEVASDNYVALPISLGVREAMTELVARAARCDNISLIYALDTNGRLVGGIPLASLIVARAGDPLPSLVVSPVPSIPIDTPIDECTERLGSLEYDSVALTDQRGRLVGVLGARELAALSIDELGDDYARLGGVDGEEEPRETVVQSLARRLPWLFLLFFLGFFISGVIGAFEAIVAELSVVVAFQSLILGMAGNVGTQSLTVTVRRLGGGGAVGSREALRLVLREARIALAIALTIGAVSLAVVWLYLFALRGESGERAAGIALCTSIALGSSIVISGISGCTIPILLERMGADPAVASGPFITTLNDLLAVVIYYGLASLMLL